MTPRDLELARRIVSIVSLNGHGRTTREIVAAINGHHGIRPTPMEAIARALQMAEEGGALVVLLDPDGPAGERERWFTPDRAPAGLERATEPFDMPADLWGRGEVEASTRPAGTHLNGGRGKRTAWIGESMD